VLNSLLVLKGRIILLAVANGAGTIGTTIFKPQYFGTVFNEVMFCTLGKVTLYINLQYLPVHLFEPVLELN
jgi:hypothetical protein